MLNRNAAIIIVQYVKTHSPVHWDTMVTDLDTVGISASTLDEVMDVITYSNHPDNPDGFRYVNRNADTSMYTFIQTGQLRNDESTGSLTNDARINTAYNALKDSLCTPCPDVPSYSFPVVESLLDVLNSPCVKSAIHSNFPLFDMDDYAYMLANARAELNNAM